uniref:Ammonium transporter AmtB-like domain-containing protein n=1 Tax=Timema monikensis TaxID=170555 RepID=A0A7R9E511_9NEOP|nr:unnamed protein product [Timema monikensis]
MQQSHLPLFDPCLLLTVSKTALTAQSQHSPISVNGTDTTQSQHSPISVNGSDTTRHSPSTVLSVSLLHSKYMFQDVHVMIFAGFGFLMSFLKRYGYSSTGFTLLLGALMVQWGILCHGFFRLDPLDHKIPISIESLLSADVATAAILISMGAVLGKTTPLQLLIMGFIEMIVFTANEYLGVEVFKAVDAGGSMYVHVFGAYFGLAVSLTLGHGKVIAKSEGEDSNEGSSYTSDIFAMIATIFLWLFWPSFNAGLSTGDDKHRAVINTYLSLASCCVMAFATSAVVNKDNKFDMLCIKTEPSRSLPKVVRDHALVLQVHIQNSTLAGGVAVGTVCDLMIHPFGAVLIGMLAGVVSVLGYRFLQPYLLSLIHLHDTCGVNNLHGIPGVMSGVMGAVVAGLATEKDYNYSLYQQFPARMPPANSSDYWEYAAHLGGDVHPGVGRSASGQAGYQLLALSVTFLVAWVSGALTGTQWCGGCLETLRSGVRKIRSLIIINNFCSSRCLQQPRMFSCVIRTTAPPGAVMRSSTVQGGVTLQLFSDDPFWHLGEDERVLTLAPIFRVSESRATRTSGGEDIFSTRVHSPASTSASVDQSRRHVLTAVLLKAAASVSEKVSIAVRQPNLKYNGLCRFLELLLYSV